MKKPRRRPNGKRGMVMTFYLDPASESIIKNMAAEWGISNGKTLDRIVNDWTATRGDAFGKWIDDIRAAELEHADRCTKKKRGRVDT